MYLGDIPQEKYEVMRQHNLRFTWRTYEELGMEIITHRDWNILFFLMKKLVWATLDNSGVLSTAIYNSPLRRVSNSVEVSLLNV
jgi:hypothetical protein